MFYKEYYHMIDLYYAPTPQWAQNYPAFGGGWFTLSYPSRKYQCWRSIHTSVLAISPNNKIPAIVDQQPVDGGAPISLFDR